MVIDLRPLEARIQALEKLVSAQAQEIADLKARPAASPSAAAALPKKIALKTDHGTYLTAEPDGRMTNRENHPASWQTDERWNAIGSSRRRARFSRRAAAPTMRRTRAPRCARSARAIRRVRRGARQHGKDVRRTAGQEDDAGVVRRRGNLAGLVGDARRGADGRRQPGRDAAVEGLRRTGCRSSRSVCSSLPKRPSRIARSSRTSPSAVTRFEMPASNARSSSTPRTRSTPVMPASARIRRAIAHADEVEQHVGGQVAADGDHVARESPMRIVRPIAV